MTHSFWWTLLLAARLLPPVMLIPALGGKVLVTPAKVGLAVLLAASLAPATVPLSAPPQGLELLLCAVREATIGMMLAFVGRCLFMAFEAGGRLIDEAIGGDRLRSSDILSGEQNSPFMQLKLLLAVLLFYQLGGPENFLNSFKESLQLFPLAASSHQTFDRAISLLRMFSSSMEFGLTLALPALAASWFTEILLGTAGRFLPQMPVHFMALPVKYTLALMAIALFLSAVFPEKLSF